MRSHREKLVPEMVVLISLPRLNECAHLPPRITTGRHNLVEELLGLVELVLPNQAIHLR